LGVIGIGNLDPQLSIRARIGLAVLLQSLASEGVRRWRRGESVTGEPGQVLSLNIERALQKGGLLPLDGAAGPSHVRISDSARRMVVSLRERFNDLRCHERDWLDVVLLSLWGGAGGPVAPPVSPAQYQLWLLAGSGGRAEGLSSRLWQVASKIRQDPAYDPMVAELGPPSFSKRDWCPGPAETARSGDDALSVLGDRVRALRGLGQQVPVGAQVALQVALAFKLAGKEPVSRTYAAWGLGALEPPPQRIELQGGPL
jgi:hypothetical protein